MIFLPIDVANIPTINANMSMSDILILTLITKKKNTREEVTRNINIFVNLL